MNNPDKDVLVLEVYDKPNHILYFKGVLIPPYKLHIIKNIITSMRQYNQSPLIISAYTDPSKPHLFSTWKEFISYLDRLSQEVIS
jgi:hypothetical protein